MSLAADRRTFLAAAATGVLSLTARGEAQQPTPALAKPSIPFSLGTVTYNLCAEWDLDTILRILPKTGLTHVEFRTTHKHGTKRVTRLSR